jgi:hypothetical protein
MTKRATAAIASAALSLALFSSTIRDAHAASEIHFGPKDVRSVTFVAKSTNKNQLHYAIALDDRCMPNGAAPVYNYWLMREHGDAIEPVSDREQRAFGISSQTVSGNTVEVRLRGLPDRPVKFETSQAGGACTARAIAPIDGEMSRVDNVYVKFGFPFRVKSVLVQGNALQDGRVRTEEVHP